MWSTKCGITTFQYCHHQIIDYCIRLSLTSIHTVRQRTELMAREIRHGQRSGRSQKIVQLAWPQNFLHRRRCVVRTGMCVDKTVCIIYSRAASTLLFRATCYETTPTPTPSWLICHLKMNRKSFHISAARPPQCLSTLLLEQSSLRSAAYSW